MFNLNPNIYIIYIYIHPIPTTINPLPIYIFIIPLIHPPHTSQKHPLSASFIRIICIRSQYPFKKKEEKIPYAYTKKNILFWNIFNVYNVYNMEAYLVICILSGKEKRINIHVQTMKKNIIMYEIWPEDAKRIFLTIFFFFLQYVTDAIDFRLQKKWVLLSVGSIW